MVSNNSHGEEQYRTVLKSRLSSLESEATDLREQRVGIDARLARIDEETMALRILLGTEQDAAAAPIGFPAYRVATATDVVRLLEEVREPLHYREIERGLKQKGFETGAGADSANALLTRYYNDSRLYRPRRGTYALRAWAESKSVPSVGQRHKRAKR